MNDRREQRFIDEFNLGLPFETPSPNGSNAMNDNTVGKLRQQSAFCDSERRVVLVSTDPEVSKILQTLDVVHFFPDTTNEHGSFGESTFKIKVEKKPIAQRL